MLEHRYMLIKSHKAGEPPGFGIEIFAHDRVGLISDISRSIAEAGESMSYIQSWVEPWDEMNKGLRVLVQFDDEPKDVGFLESLKMIQSVISIQLRPTYRKIWGKRVIVLGGGAQVSMVASGAIVEADRHNIRGETISVDTIPVVGEEEIARAVIAVGRLHRAAILVLAGALMGGKITEAVQELRRDYGIPVIALKMAGSVTEVADLVISDPTEAGVMAVMAISNVGKFNILTVHGKVY